MYVILGIIARVPCGQYIDRRAPLRNTVQLYFRHGHAGRLPRTLAIDRGADCLDARVAISVIALLGSALHAKRLPALQELARCRETTLSLPPPRTGHGQAGRGRGRRPLSGGRPGGVAKHAFRVNILREELQSKPVLKLVQEVLINRTPAAESGRPRLPELIACASPTPSSTDPTWEGSSPRRTPYLRPREPPTPL